MKAFCNTKRHRAIPSAQVSNCFVRITRFATRHTVGTPMLMDMRSGSDLMAN